MTIENFDYILEKITPMIKKQDTMMRKAIPPEVKLTITLHHLAEGASFSNIALHYRLGRQTVTDAIYETCEAIWSVLQPLYLKAPTREDWNRISKEFEAWDFPNCLGSLDGKHIRMQKPANQGSLYFNYKQTESIVLMALCDAKYRFVLVDIGAAGSQSDGGVFEASGFGRAFLNDQVNLPPAKVLPGDERGETMPHVIVADEAFPLKPFMLRPFPGKQLVTNEKKVFNYRLSRARRVVENAFGILSHRWRLLFQPIIARPDKVTILVQAMCVLHNYLRTVRDQSYHPPGLSDALSSDGQITDGFWRSQPASLNSIGRSTTHNTTTQAAHIRDYFTTYFSSCGTVEWQLDYVNAR